MRNLTQTQREQARAYDRKYKQKNRLAIKERAKSWPSRLDATRRKGGRLLANYGITLADYERMFAEQQGRCKICSEARKLVVDHDHKSGTVRGLLCDRCNTAIGALGDTVESLQRVVTYLARLQDHA